MNRTQSIGTTQLNTIAQTHLPCPDPDVPCTCRSTLVSFKTENKERSEDSREKKNKREELLGNRLTVKTPNAVPGTVARDAFCAIVFRTALLVDDRTVTPRQRLAAVQAVAFLFAFVY